MAVKRDYYEVLGIDRTTDASGIKKAYRKLAKKYHPDTNKDDAQAEQKFKEITEAYSILSDPEKKKLYDKFGHAAFEEGAAAGEAYRGDDGMDDLFGDLFKDMFRGGYAERRSQGFGSGFGREFRQKGADMRARVSVSFEEAAFGCEKVITLQNPEVANDTQTLKVHIPAGIDSGKSVRLRGKGGPGIGGGEPGDLLLKVTVGEKAGFERKGRDVLTTVSIPYTTAVFGGEVRVSTLYGDVICKIHEGTQSGSKIRLKGKGIVSMKDAAVHGDQYVTVQIQVPKHLNQEAKQKLMEYKQACG